MNHIPADVIQEWISQDKQELQEIKAQRKTFEKLKRKFILDPERSKVVSEIIKGLDNIAERIKNAGHNRAEDVAGNSRRYVVRAKNQGESTGSTDKLPERIERENLGVAKEGIDSDRGPDFPGEECFGFTDS